MTGEAVREIFFRHFVSAGEDTDNLNQALLSTNEDVFVGLLAELSGPGEALPDIVRTIAKGRSRLGIFAPMFAAGKSAHYRISMSSLAHLDHIRKAVLDTANYMLTNYETVHSWFRESVSRNDLELVISKMSGLIENPMPGLASNQRAMTASELKLDDEVLLNSLVGILGPELFKKFCIEYNECTKTLRQCQAEAKLMRSMSGSKDS